MVERRMSAKHMDVQKVYVKLHIKSAKLRVGDEAKNLKVVWTRGANSKQRTETKSISVDAQNDTATFNDSMRCNPRMRWDTASQTFRDENKITLYCDNDVLGQIVLDLAPLVDKPAQSFQSELRSADYVPTNDQEMVLVGDVSKFPGAVLSFKLGVTSEEE